MKMLYFWTAVLTACCAMTFATIGGVKAQNIQDVTTLLGMTHIKLAKTNIEAPLERVFPLIADYQQWHLWVAHEKNKAEFSRNISSPSTGVGAVYEWKGSGEAGEGRARILQLEAPTRVVVGFDFKQPITGRLEVAFTLRREGALTVAEIETRGPADLLNYFNDKFLEHGLMRLACVAESSTKPFCEFLAKGLN